MDAIRTQMTTRPVEVDTRLAALWDAEQSAERDLYWASDALHTALGERRGRHPQTWEPLPWPTTDDEAEAQAEALAATAPETRPARYDEAVWRAIAVREALAKYRSRVAALRAIRAEAEPLEAEFRATRWSRFFLVTNPGGHIHRDRSCSTCRSGTRYAWLPSLSGLTEADAVAQEGTRLCSVCYPSAPVEWTVGLPKRVDPNRCPGSGQDPVMHEDTVESRNRFGALVPRRRVWYTCPACGAYAHVNERACTVRAHRSPKPKKGSTR